MAVKLLVAKYPGRCSKCKGPIEEGMRILWEASGKPIAHQDCEHPKGQAADPLAPHEERSPDYIGRLKAAEDPAWLKSEDCPF